MKRSGFSRNIRTDYARTERIAPTYTRLTVKVNMPRVSDEVLALPKEDVCRSDPYRRLVAALPCAHCQIEGLSQAAHPPPTGKGIKASDLECFPLCCARPGVPGCHYLFDQYKLMPKAHMRGWAAVCAEETREIIDGNGQWPKNLPRLETTC